MRFITVTETYNTKVRQVDVVVEQITAVADQDTGGLVHNAVIETTARNYYVHQTRRQVLALIREAVDIRATIAEE